MKTYFNDIYLPVKQGITGTILQNVIKRAGELEKQIDVTYELPQRKGERCILLVLFYKGQHKSFVYGKTIKEIRQLCRDVNDFNYDPHLFLNL